MRGARSLLFVAALGLASCRSHRTTADAGAQLPWSNEPPWPGLTLDLTPDPGRDELSVEVRVAGARAAGVTELTAARRWADTRGADALGPVEAHDAEGPLPLHARAPREGVDDVDDVIVLGRPPRGGDLRVRYRVRANALASRFALRMGSDRLSGVGHAFLLLPRIEVKIPAKIRWHLGALAAAKDLGAASSLGTGVEITTTATSEDIAHAAYLAGPMRIEEPLPTAAAEAGHGKRLVVLGAPAFDTRAAFYWSITTFGAAQRFFEGPTEAKAAEPFSFLLSAEAFLGASHDGASLTRSFGLWFDASRAFDAGLKSVIAHELVHRWIGGEIRLVDARGREAIWFSEGFTVHFARRVLLDARLVAPRDILADLRRTTDEPTLGEAACAEERRSRSQEEYRRGARYAAVLDRALRRASNDRRSLDDLLRELLGRARAQGHGALSTAAFRELVVRALGAEGSEGFDRWIERGEPIDLPSDAFGPCFRRAARWEVKPCPGFR